MGMVQTVVSGSSEYHKIETLFERDKMTFVVNPDILKSPVLGTIREWDVTEKIDGTNTRVILGLDGAVRFGGKTNNAQMPTGLLEVLMVTFTPEKMQAAMWIDGPVEAVLYGEGYGAGIQKGGCYSPTKRFRLFDVLVAGKWWLDRAAVDDVAAKLSIKTVPYLGRWELAQIVHLVRDGFRSKVADEENPNADQVLAEGVVARPIEPLFDRKGARIIIKLKTKDFQSGKR